MSIATAYRPETFEEVVGNDITVNALRKALKREQDIPKCFLFTGPSGTGKTTLARIVANELNGVLSEMNTADLNGVDTSRQIIAESRYQSLSGQPKLYLIDECHQLTKSAQEALLKEMEDGPEGVYLIFATTDPQQLKPTFKRRCADYKLKPVPEKELTELLIEVQDAEGASLSEKTLGRIIQVAEGSPGRALALFDSVMEMDNEEATQYLADQGAETEQVIDLCRALKSGKAWKDIAGILKGLDGDPEGTRRAVMGYMSKALVSNGDKRTFLMLDAFLEPYYNSGKAGLVASCYAAFIQGRG